MWTISTPLLTKVALQSWQTYGRSPADQSIKYYFNTSTSQKWGGRRRWRREAKHLQFASCLWGPDLQQHLCISSCGPDLHEHVCTCYEQSIVLTGWHKTVTWCAHNDLSVWLRSKLCIKPICRTRNVSRQEDPLSLSCLWTLTTHTIKQ